MEIITGLHNIRPRHKGCVLTIGNFDGVHRGHQRLIEHLREQSQRLQVPSMLMTFEPQPREFFAGAMLPARLTRFREKVQLLQGTGSVAVHALQRKDRANSRQLVCRGFHERAGGCAVCGHR